MDRLDRLQLFVRIVERRSFTAAAADSGLARSTATEAIKQLEADIGARLLERTTRHVMPTLDGEAFYHRCLSILSDVEAAENAFRDDRPRGLLRIDANAQVTRTFLLPHLPAFLERYPLIDLHLGQGDRLVDLLRDGVDCVIRAGEPSDSGMIMRRLALVEEVTCASPAYLEAHGVPTSPDGLDGHVMIGFLSSRSGEVLPLEFTVAGKRRDILLPTRVTTNSSDTMHELARMGLGLVQAPRYRFRQDFEEGMLVEVLKDYPPSPTPYFALYPQNRQLAPRLRVFLAWATAIFAEAKLSRES
ncbi:LysR family transcriptional regulator [Rhizobium sp. B230/85]|uniref:LysR family transcriptional regulator n=1 Tax=unclassified Rhizobium TaxID=2613769 RepID=UPI001ADC85C2|nr:MULTISPECIES: LysR family transcriptional regulator [unclassified Rhizobium]MBO9135865.1 LysR family transcriptional regulator [Rhizobium sp. B209b/85]QXZ95998.1 LysR family transcriptional regulator [Rhizobium sp. B230/85]